MTNKERIDKLAQQVITLAYENENLRQQNEKLTEQLWERVENPNRNYD